MRLTAFSVNSKNIAQSCLENKNWQRFRRAVYNVRKIRSTSYSQSLFVLLTFIPYGKPHPALKSLAHYRC